MNKHLRRNLPGLLLAAVAVALPHAGSASPQAQSGTVGQAGSVFPTSASQGAMVIGKVPPGSAVTYAGRSLRPTAYGSVVFGIGRDATGPLQIDIQPPNAATQHVTITVTPRDWPIEQVNGAPPATVNPPRDCRTHRA